MGVNSSRFSVRFGVFLDGPVPIDNRPETTTNFVVFKQKLHPSCIMYFYFVFTIYTLHFGVEVLPKRLRKRSPHTCV